MVWRQYHGVLATSLQWPGGKTLNPSTNCPKNYILDHPIRANQINHLQKFEPACTKWSKHFGGSKRAILASVLNQHINIVSERDRGLYHELTLGCFTNGFL